LHRVGTIVSEAFAIIGELTGSAFITVWTLPSGALAILGLTQKDVISIRAITFFFVLSSVPFALIFFRFYNDVFVGRQKWKYEVYTISTACGPNLPKTGCLIINFNRLGYAVVNIFAALLACKNLRLKVSFKMYDWIERERREVPGISVHVGEIVGSWSHRHHWLGPEYNR